MELLLNIFWLIIAAGSLGIWIRQWRRGARWLGLPLQLCALGSVLVLLFPVISATDDLHATALIVEASGFSPQNTEEHHADWGISPSVAAGALGPAIAGAVPSGNVYAHG